MNKRQQRKDQPQDDPYKEVQTVIGKVYYNLNAAQQNFAKEALRGQDNHPIYLKGKSLVNLICHDFCLAKYPFKKYTFDYEQYVNSYLESERYEWLMEDICSQIEQNWENIDCDSKGSMKILQILSGAFTTENNNKNRQKKIAELKQILYYIFELNFICTSFTRPNFSPQECCYKQTLNSVSQKLQNKFKFNSDIECDDMKNPYKEIEGFYEKPKHTNFRSQLNFLGEVNILSLGELNKNHSLNLLSKELLLLITCFKECSEVLTYITEQTINETSTTLSKSSKEVFMYVIKCMDFLAIGNVQLIDQSLDEMLDKSQSIIHQNNIPILLPSIIPEVQSQLQDSAQSIKSTF